MSEKDDENMVQCSIEVARRIKHFLRDIKPELIQKYWLDESIVDIALTAGALRGGVYQFVQDSGISDDERGQLVQQVGDFINEFLDEKGE